MIYQFEVKLILKYIQGNFLSAEQVAGRIYAHDYGFNQHRNRPPLPTDRVLSVLECHTVLVLVTQDDKHWHLLLLLHIVNIVF